jgi:hypothetical protein
MSFSMLFHVLVMVVDGLEEFRQESHMCSKEKDEGSTATLLLARSKPYGLGNGSPFCHCDVSWQSCPWDGLCWQGAVRGNFALYDPAPQPGVGP